MKANLAVFLSVISYAFATAIFESLHDHRILIYQEHDFLQILADEYSVDTPKAAPVCFP